MVWLVWLNVTRCQLVTFGGWFAERVDHQGQSRRDVEACSTVMRPSQARMVSFQAVSSSPLAQTLVSASFVDDFLSLVLFHILFSQRPFKPCRGPSRCNASDGAGFWRLTSHAVSGPLTRSARRLRWHRDDPLPHHLSGAHCGCETIRGLALAADFGEEGDDPRCDSGPTMAARHPACHHRLGAGS